MTTRAFQKIYTKIDNITKATVTLRAQGVGNDELATVGGKLAQVVKIMGENVTLQVFAGTEGLATDSEVVFHGEPPKLRVSDNLAGRFFNAYGEPLEGGEIVEGEARELLAQLGLAEHADKVPCQLSGGQQQRLCIARGVAVKPEVLLLDEPCSALDPISTARIEELIEELKNDYTVVIVTHSMQQAARVSDYTAFLYLGELIETGPTTDIFTRPQKKATEDYITGRFG